MESEQLECVSFPCLLELARCGLERQVLGLAESVDLSARLAGTRYQLHLFLDAGCREELGEYLGRRASVSLYDIGGASDGSEEAERYQCAYVRLLVWPNSKFARPWS